MTSLLARQNRPGEQFSGVKGINMSALEAYNKIIWKGALSVAFEAIHNLYTMYKYAPKRNMLIYMGHPLSPPLQVLVPTCHPR
jgi:hypothetical protein